MAENGAAPHTDFLVRLVNLKKTYFSGPLSVPVLKGINFEGKSGAYGGIIGTSGAGKSTLLNILGMLDIPTEGKYILEDIEVEKLSDSELANIRNRKIGFIFQSFNLFPHLTVEQNIEVPMLYARIPAKERRRRAIELANEVKLGHRLGHKPTQLSGGECQRVAVARALSNRPAFLLADEPTGNLDEKPRIEIMKLFHALHESGSTNRMVTHNPALETHFDQVIRLRDGLTENTLGEVAQ